MATGESMQFTKQLGEFLLAAELCRRNLTATTFAGNVPVFDIVAVNPNRDLLLIQVKTIKSDSWQFHINEFAEIEMRNTVQVLKGRNNRLFPI